VAGDHRSRAAASGAARHCVVERLDGAAGDTENVFDTHLLKIGDDQIGDLRGFVGQRLLQRSRC
jgi:hypothetical protein